jgi:hypothetical protein
MPGILRRARLLSFFYALERREAMTTEHINPQDVKNGMVLYVEGSYGYRNVVVARSDGYLLPNGHPKAYFVDCEDVVSHEISRFGGLSGYGPSLYQIRINS